MGYRTWIYHETEDPKIINSDNYDLFHEDGWRDSPACFVKVADFDVDPNDAAAVQNLGDTVQGVADALNDALNIGKMKKPELLEYADVHYGVKLNELKRVADLRKDLEALTNGNSE